MQGNQHLLWRLENAGTYLMGSITHKYWEDVWLECTISWNIIQQEPDPDKWPDLSEPDLTNQIVAVLLSFREQQIAVTSDIEAIYHQVKVPENQRFFLRFLRRKEKSLQQSYCWTWNDSSCIWCHIIGIFSNYALKETEAKNDQIYGEEM